jgi:hypothetical protein
MASIWLLGGNAAGLNDLPLLRSGNNNRFRGAAGIKPFPLRSLEHSPGKMLA